MYESDMSDEINELAAALAKAQGAMQAAKFDRTMRGDKYEFRYATLASVWEAVRKPLSDNGLAVTQVLRIVGDGGRMVLYTTLMHTSGQWVRAEYPIMPQGNTPQAVGSAITYAKRYSLAAIVGVPADEDDDGDAAAGGGVKAPKGGPSRGQGAQSSRQQPPDGNGRTEGEDKRPPLVSIETQAQINKAGITHYGSKEWPAKRTALVNAITKGEAQGRLERLTAEDADKLLKGIQAKMDAGTNGDGAGEDQRQDQRQEQAA